MTETNDASIMCHPSYTQIAELFIKELRKQSAEIELLNRRIDQLEKQNAIVKPPDVEIDLAKERTEEFETDISLKHEEHETRKQTMRIDQENQELRAQICQVSEAHPCVQHINEFKTEFTKLNKDNQRFKQQIFKVSSAIAQLQPFLTEMINAKKEFQEVRKEFQLLMPMVDELGDVNEKIQSMLKIIGYLTEYMVINEKSKGTNNSIVVPFKTG
ncbi:7485_t:CDS:1 [Acaulospora morrowiae]|uniref:7485_t:CDS:1 n=1 Tax=Acaulospora morrowiae TaxID=94023 RepID=A0A9N9H7T3_9GLOM|nr:7485_t:CDS:1 [Acaulospora morrowiae]